MNKTCSRALELYWMRNRILVCGANQWELIHQGNGVQIKYIDSCGWSELVLIQVMFLSLLYNLRFQSHLN